MKKILLNLGSIIAILIPSFNLISCFKINENEEKTNIEKIEESLTSKVLVFHQNIFNSSGIKQANLIASNFEKKFKFLLFKADKIIVKKFINDLDGRNLEPITALNDEDAKEIFVTITRENKKIKNIPIKVRRFTTKEINQYKLKKVLEWTKKYNTIEKKLTIDAGGNSHTISVDGLFQRGVYGWERYAGKHKTWLEKELLVGINLALRSDNDNKDGGQINNGILTYPNKKSYSKEMRILQIEQNKKLVDVTPLGGENIIDLSTPKKIKIKFFFGSNFSEKIEGIANIFVDAINIGKHLENNN